MRYTDRDMIRLACDTLTTDELDVWMSKHISGFGRRAGSMKLGISEEAWRLRLSKATRKITTRLEEDAA